MLCDSGVVSATALTTSGTLAATTWARRSLATAAGSGAATRALTTATPSRLLRGVALLWTRTVRVLEALTPPMQTVGMAAWPAPARAARMERTPAGPMMDFVSRLVGVAKTVPSPR
jgi:hypothetical protein